MTWLAVVTVLLPLTSANWWDASAEEFHARQMHPRCDARIVRYREEDSGPAFRELEKVIEGVR